MYRKFFGISLEYPISQKKDKTYVPTIFWDIPGIFHIPKIDKVGMHRFHFGIYPYPIFFLTYVPRMHKV